MKCNALRSLAGLFFLSVFLTFPTWAGAAAVPDLRGTWQGTQSQYEFKDVTINNAAPVFSQGDANLKITTQKGRVFAGRFMQDGKELKVTGAIAPDNTISLQIFKYHSRAFFVGKLTVTAAKFTLSGIVHAYDEMTLSSEPGMSSIYVTISKPR
jgi:hypothetical protein